jgi:hypothetical protein
MIFIGTRFCNLHRDDTRLHLPQTSKKRPDGTKLSFVLHPRLFGPNMKIGKDQCSTDGAKDLGLGFHK